MRSIDLIVIHCSATGQSADIGAADIRKWHTSPPRNWSDIGYHYVIRRDGRLEPGRPEEAIGAHAQGHNATSLGICVVGGVDADNKALADFNYTRAQMATLESLISDLLLKYPKAAVCGHRDLPNVDKACPCFNVRAWWYGAEGPAIA